MEQFRLHRYIPEDPKLPFGDRVKNAYTDVRVEVPGIPEETFTSVVCESIDRSVQNLPVTRTPLFDELPEFAHVVTNATTDHEESGVVSFHFPGAGGEWDENRYGPHAAGYAGAALRGGVDHSVISGWRYAYLTDEERVSTRHEFDDDVQDILVAVQASGAKRIYLSARSYGCLVTLAAVPELKELGIEIVGIDLKVPAFSSNRYNEWIADVVGDIPVLITRGDHDLNTSILATDELFTMLRGPKAMVTLTDPTARGLRRFDHDLEVPELQMAAAAATTGFLRLILSAR